MSVSFSQSRAGNPANIRKILEFAVFVKHHEDSDEEITKIWKADGLVIPAGYQSLGVIKKDGETWTRDQSTSDVTSHGYTEPTRRDITSDVTGLQLTAQESKLQTIELYNGVDLSEMTTDADGNFAWDRPSRPSARDLRVLAVGKDGEGPDAVYLARWLPRAQVTGMGQQSWNEDTEVEYPLTLTAYVDSEFGTSFREIWGGPGLDHTAMGLPAPTGP